MLSTTTTLARPSSSLRAARTVASSAAASSRRASVGTLPRRRVAMWYTSQQGRAGEGGEEETSLQENLRKMTSEQQYGKTTGVPEEQQPGFYHESRGELERMGAVVHEEIGGPGQAAHHAAAPESGTEGRTSEGGAGAQHFTGGGPGSSAASHANPSNPVSEVTDDEIASAPESGTRS